MLMRHGDHVGGTLTAEGIKGVTAVASRLGEWLDAEPMPIVGYFTSTNEVLQTASVLAAGLQLARPSATCYGGLSFRRPPADAADGSLPEGLRDDPIALGPYPPEPSMFEALCKALVKSPADGSTPVLVGNDPLISRLASEIAREPIALGRGELLCLRATSTGKHWSPVWTIDPHGGDDYDALASKIESKMNTAKALGAVMTGLFAFVTQNVIREQPGWPDWLSLLLLATSAGLYFAALFLYDGLLMPPRYWGSTEPFTPSSTRNARAWNRVRHGRPGLARPPSAASRVLQQAMVRIWNRVFIPATSALAAGATVMTIGATRPSSTIFMPDWRAICLAGAWLLGCVVWVSANRPRLGSSD